MNYFLTLFCNFFLTLNRQPFINPNGNLAGPQLHSFRWISSIAIAGLAAGLLAACQMAEGLPLTMGKRPPPLAIEMPPHLGQPTTMEGVAVVRPVERPEAPDTEVDIAAVPLPHLKPRPEAVNLIGFTEGQALAVLGRPQTRHDDPPARIWRYASDGCVVDVYFYLDVSRNTFHVLHYTTPNNPASDEFLQNCLQAVRDARSKL